ncbi:hypothetical protein DFJ73DRAFT_180649 [Zopfochytrium polystomum]|nr:hypothetical protein DFJ73DRAFT_180649 [Zopfochytrium polystomum]
MSSSPPTPSFAPSPSYASAAATQQQLNSTAPPPGLSPPPGIDPSRRKMSAPEPSIRIALVDRSDAPKPMTSALSGKPPGLSSHADSARLSAAAQSRSRSPSPGKWANSRLPHKKPADGDHPSSSRPQSQQSAHPLSPEPPSDSLTNEEAEDLVLSRKRRNRTSSTPNALVVDGDPSNVVPDVSKTGARRGSHAPPSQKWNAGLGGWSNTPTIWKEGGDAPAASKVPTFLGPDPSQYRRFSYTVEKDGDDSKRHVLRQPLRGDDEEDQGLDTGKSRSRPKSSSSASGSAVEGKAPESGPRRSSGASNYSEFSSIWASSREQGDNAESPASQRRGSLQPSSRGGWGESAPPVDHLSPFAHTLGLPSKLQQRRLSHSPNLFSDAPTKRLNRCAGCQIALLPTLIRIW